MDVARAENELRKATFHVSVCGHHSRTLAITQYELRVSGDLTWRMRQEITPWQFSKERIDLGIADTQSYEFFACPVPAAFDARLEQGDRLVLALGTRFQHLSGPLIELPQQLSLPVSPCLDRRSTNIRKGGQIEISQIRTIPADLRKFENQLGIGKISALCEMRHQEMMLDDEQDAGGSVLREPKTLDCGLCANNALVRVISSEPLANIMQQAAEKEHAPVLHLLHQLGEFGHDSSIFTAP